MPGAFPPRSGAAYWRVAIRIGLLLLLAWAVPANAQLSLGGLGQEEQTQETPHDAETFQQSLDDVITTLEDDERRGALLDELREIRQVHEGGSAEDSIQRQGLLGALAETFSELGDQAEAGESPLDDWRRQLEQGWAGLSELVVETGTGEIARFAVHSAVLLGIWAGALVILVALGRLLFVRQGLPLDLPREPRGWLLALHFLRRMLPWALAFVLTMGLVQVLPPSPGRTLALIFTYLALCGRTLSVVVECVVSVFTRGHRFPAVVILQQRGLRLLFVIGALIALGDALNAERLSLIVGEEPAALGSVFANMLAALLSIRFIFKFKRPIKHLIRNRSWRVRREGGTAIELARVVGELWHVPALLIVVVSLLAIFVTVGDVGTALARSIISAALLVSTLVVTGLIQRHSERRSRRRRISEYRRRLERVGYALSHMVAWIVFAELSLQVWGGSLFGLGREGVAGVRIGQALLALGFTVLLAWLAWIFADTAIQRALVSSARSRGRRVNQARAQTITPMIRNVIFATIVLIAAIVGLANLGVNVTPLLAGAGVIGLAVGFGAQTLVQDLITGIFIIVEDSLAVDDFVQINGHMGTVEGLTLRTVRLRDLDGILHIITFSAIQSIHNMSRHFGIALMRIRIPHTMKIDDAISLMQETAQELRQDPMMRHYIWSPLEMQGVDRFDEGAAVLRMRFRTAPVMQWDVARAFNLLLKQRMEQQGLDLGMPRLSVSMEGQPGDAMANGEPEGGDTAPPRDAKGRAPGEAGIADPEGATNPQRASPDSS
ncbi:mechanosensitive ion channel family protein [Halomonas sp. MCCC 1A17488]|uniref:mechanosensitive ion channel family protein n=1 Tax=unclassified Halomonas TaxID=2609666 RepID=UPI0018D20D87|nr:MULTISPECIES: mechanosensitive ion channel domain-containing protein [unclassified Halomonas]MCE8016048.1 mechanosensitive ion channel family protein [Halomonas sp. MCCC 1A17488]MCG3239381.1 mechanosensitive ion channel family protein [Halomonas sp. MCCC 1A17488]QPP50689.1 mechanosensitive ion channel family protein [Halomonas sp. SS10-MC5]